jgi:hypothetical protein
MDQQDTDRNRQKTIDSLFQPCTTEDMELAKVREVQVLLQEAQVAHEVQIIKPSDPLKRRPCRPRKQLEPVLMAIKEESDKDASPRIEKKRKRDSYQNWFSPDLWPPIHEAVKKHCNLSSALRYLRAAHRQPGHPNCPYEKLSRTSLSTWFTSGGELRSKFCNAIKTESTNLASHSYSQRLYRKP